MNGFLVILEFVILFGLLVFLHEFGHFLMARLFKIEVEEFGFGFPPRIVKLFTLGGTDFTLNWIPFGGFVRPKGENDSTVPGGLGAASPWARLAVMLGGPVMNLITGILVFSFVLTMGGDPTPRTVDIATVSPDSPAAAAGIQAGDIIQSINGKPVTSQIELRSVVQENLDKPVSLTYLRSGKPVQVSLTPRSNPPEGQGSLGIAMLSPRLSFF